MDVEFSQNGASGVITLNRPDALNALTLSMVRDMTPVLNDWARDPSIEHVVIEGAGEKVSALVVIFVPCMIGDALVRPRQPAFIARNMRSTISSKHFPSPILR
jgi:enoyl-CoA hydratase